MENITPAELKSLQEELDKKYASQFELIKVAMYGRIYYKAAHKESGLGMWSHDVAIEEANRNKAKSQQLNSEHP